MVRFEFGFNDYLYRLCLLLNILRSRSSLLLPELIMISRLFFYQLLFQQRKVK